MDNYELVPNLDSQQYKQAQTKSSANEKKDMR